MASGAPGPARALRTAGIPPLGLGVTRPLATALLLFGLWQIPVPAQADGGPSDDPPAAEDESPSAFRLELGVGWSRAVRRFMSVATVAGEACEGRSGACRRPASATLPMVRGTAGLGLGALTLEGSVAVPVGGEATSSTWTGGIRIDTSTDAVLSAFFRFAYVHRRGELAGQGGRFGIGAQIRPGVSWLTLFGEAALQASSVPGYMNDRGALFAYTTWLGFGARLAFGP